MNTEATESLESRIQEMTANLGRLKVRHWELSRRLDEIVSAVRRGDASRANDTGELVRQQTELSKTIRNQEQELQEAQSEQARQKQASDRAKLREIITRMQQRREHITRLARELALELGALHTEDRQAGVKLVGEYASADRREFFEALEPISPLNGAWIASKRDVVLDFVHVIKIRPVTPL